MSAEPLPDRDEFDWEIVALIDEYGSERAALRVTYATLKTVLVEPPRVSRRPFGLSYAAMAGSSSMA